MDVGLLSVQTGRKDGQLPPTTTKHLTLHLSDLKQNRREHEFMFKRSQNILFVVFVLKIKIACMWKRHLDCLHN